MAFQADMHELRSETQGRRGAISIFDGPYSPAIDTNPEGGFLHGKWDGWSCSRTAAV